MTTLTSYGFRTEQVRKRYTFRPNSVPHVISTTRHYRARHVTTTSDGSVMPLLTEVAREATA